MSHGEVLDVAEQAQTELATPFRYLYFYFLKNGQFDTGDLQTDCMVKVTLEIDFRWNISQIDQMGCHKKWDLAVKYGQSHHKKTE